MKDSPRLSTVKRFDQAVASVVVSRVPYHDLDVLDADRVEKYPHHPVKQNHDEKIEGEGNDDQADEVLEGHAG